MSIEVQGIEKLLNRIKNMSKEIGDEANVALRHNANKLAQNAQQDAPVDKGDLRASIQTDSTNYLEFKVGSRLKYAPYIEFGTKKKVKIPAGLESYASKFKGGSGGSFEDLEESIANWARIKGIPKEFHGLIAINVAVNGIKPQPFLFPNFEKQKPLIKKSLKEVVDKKR